MKLLLTRVESGLPGLIVRIVTSAKRNGPCSGSGGPRRSGPDRTGWAGIPNQTQFFFRELTVRRDREVHPYDRHKLL